MKVTVRIFRFDHKYIFAMGTVTVITAICSPMSTLVSQSLMNSLQERRSLKMLLVLAAIYIAVLYFIGELDTAIKIPFTSIEWIMPIWLYIPFVMFVVVGVVNAVNLTDGLDGLASSITTIVGIFFMLVSYIVFKEYGVTVFSAALIGGLIGFLWYNKYPAKVFMGDTGSLALGGFVASAAFILKMPIFIVIVGFIYLWESISVMLQVGWFKLTKRKYGEGRRLFKMAPFHHHLEKCGWKETKVVTLFYVATALLCLIGFLGCKYMFL